MKQTLRERLQRKTEKVGGCLVFTGVLDTPGYGQLRHLGRKVTVSRLAWELENGKIEPGKMILHNPKKCPTQRKDCCAVSHLYSGSRRDNAIDTIMTGHKGLKLSAGNVILMRQMLAEGLARKDIASTFAVTVKHVQRISTGKKWGWFSGSVSSAGLLQLK